MDRRPDSPWNPQVPAHISPAQFEALVLEWLRLASKRQHQNITATHLGVVHGEGGEYKVDVLVTFTALGGAGFTVLVECKHQGRPLEREDVMVLESKHRDVNAQKAIIFSTSGFQSGALEFAATKHIASVTVVDGSWLYETKSFDAKPAEPPPWVHFDRYAGLRVRTSDSADISCHTIESGRVDALEEWLADETATPEPQA